MKKDMGEDLDGSIAGADCCFLLLKPRTASDVKKVARALATNEGVKSVFVTSGDYGYIVHAAYNGEKGLKKLEYKIAKAANSDVSSVIGHFSYRGIG